MTKPIAIAAFRSRDALVSVCAKCDADGKTLRRAIKAELKARGISKRTRVVGTSCLDLCPKDAVAVAVADRRAEPGVRYYAVAGSDLGARALADALAVDPRST